MKKIFRLLFISLFIALPSCSALIFGEIPAVVDSSDKRICVIPMAVKMSNQSMGHYQSETGRRIAGFITDLIGSQGDNVTIIDADALEQDISSFRFTKPDWGNLCQKHELDFIVIGTITRFILGNDKNPDFIRGEASLDLKVVGPANEILFSGSINNIFYPEKRSQDPYFDIPGAHNFDTSPEDIRQGLENVAALKIASLFYDHTEEK